MSGDPYFCWAIAEGHDWIKATPDRRGEGLQCSGCGVTEAELDGEEPE